MDFSRAFIEGKSGRGGRGGGKKGMVISVQKNGTSLIINKELQKRLSTGICVWCGILGYIYGKYRKRNTWAFKYAGKRIPVSIKIKERV